MWREPDAEKLLALIKAVHPVKKMYGNQSQNTYGVTGMSQNWG